MRARACWKPSEELYRNNFADWVKYVSRFRKWVSLIALASFGVGAGLCVTLFLVELPAGRALLKVSLFLVLVGLYTWLWHLWDKHQWFAARRKAYVTGHEIEITFEEEQISLRGPRTRTEADWTLFQRAIPAEYGIFLYPDEGIHIYLPYDSLEPPEAKHWIVQRITNTSDLTD